MLGGYRLDGVIGRGGMGTVYRGEQVALGRPVAIKVISAGLVDDPGFRERFAREALAAAAVEHPNILPVHDAGEIDGELYLAMRYVHGSDAAAELRRGGAIGPDRALRVVADVAAALDAAHGAGLVHRDVKPANILLDAELDRAYLTDFGLARRSGSHSSVNSGWAGTVHYIAPEQIKGDDIDAGADVYALACTAFELLTGRRPFVRDNDLAVLWAHVSDPPPSARSVNPDLPAVVDEVIGRGMAKTSEQRYASAGDLSAALTAALAGDGPPRLPATAAISAARPCAPKARTSIAALCGLTYAAGVTVQASLPIPQSVNVTANPSAAGLMAFFTQERGLALAQAGTAIVAAGALLAFLWTLDTAGIAGRLSTRGARAVRTLGGLAFGLEAVALIAEVAPSFGLAARGRGDLAAGFWVVAGHVHAAAAVALAAVMVLLVRATTSRVLSVGAAVVACGLLVEAVMEPRLFAAGRAGTVLLVVWVASVSVAELVRSRELADV
ncbi:serine/threonine-protein kinase [Actinomycetospora sp. NBRC 106375]|uniref:serine/threonine-protein kinase n=1 Tax=Actinomycetospora sp. NBRC 106375 TaxID=3032207 RepID=UPI002554753B|nr:serine/threonine-protein kinase [Actinomycetospora sp. NBRC 106375]